MEFLPHTQEALDEYLNLSEPDLERSLLTMGDSVARIVPDCVGLSLTLYDEDDLTFTLVAPSVPAPRGEPSRDTDPRRSALTDEPVDEVADEAARVAAGVSDPLDEDTWASFARASAAAGVASTLSLPVVDHDRVVGGINLYASSADAFVGRHGDLAEVLGASASGAIANADLSFESRRRAEQAPRQLRDQRLVDVAVGILAAREDVDLDEARDRLEDAAARAGVSEAQAALVLIRIHQA